MEGPEIAKIGNRGDNYNRQPPSIQRDETKVAAARDTTEGDSTKVLPNRSHMKESRGEYVALRKVTVIIKNSTRRVVVKALLDDASRKTYINSDVAAELGLQGENSRVTVNVLNGQTDSLETKIFELNLQS